MKKIPELSQKSIDAICSRFLNELIGEDMTQGAAFFAVCASGMYQHFLSQEFIDAMYKEKYRLGKKLLKIINSEKKQTGF